MKKKLTATILLLITAAIWGFSVVAQILGGDHVGAFTFNGLRFLLGAVSLIPVCLILEREKELSPQERHLRHRRSAKAACICGTFLYLASALQQSGAAMIRHPAEVGFITGLYTVLTPILYLLIFRKRTGWNTWVGCVLAAVGLYFLFRQEGGTIHIGLGQGLVLIGAVFWALHILTVDHFIEHVSPLHFSAGQFFVCGSLGLVTALLTEDIRVENLKAAVWPIVFCGVIVVGLAFTLQVISQKFVPPAVAAMILSTESIFSLLGGFLWNLWAPEAWHMDQQLNVYGYIGCAVILAGILLAQLPVRTGRNESGDTGNAVAKPDIPIGQTGDETDRTGKTA